MPQTALCCNAQSNGAWMEGQGFEGHLEGEQVDIPRMSLREMNSLYLGMDTAKRMPLQSNQRTWFTAFKAKGVLPRRG